MMQLSDILDSLAPELGQISLTGLCLDSRKVKLGDVFVAIKGSQQDAAAFVPQALANGAVAALVETEQPEQDRQYQLGPKGQAIISIYQLSQQVSALAGHFYQHPGDKMTLVGVTGTNGKSTICCLMANWLTLLGQRAGVLGTIGNGLYGQLVAGLNTTGSPIEIQHELAKMQQQGASCVAMEVSSHGLDQHRVAALPFNTAIFTNLTRDHLDYHGSMAAYGAAKRRLFEFSSLQHKIINCDDEVGLAWLSEMPDAISVGFGLPASHQGKFLQVTSVQYLTHGLQFDFVSSWGEGQIQAPLYAQFNVFNLACVLTALLCQGIELQDLIQTAPKLSPVDGRMARFIADNKPTVVIDYAHTPDALAQALQGLALHCDAKLWVLFGCGGDRDKGKRPLMAQAAQQYGDQVIVVDDNPRTEPAADIVADIMAGFTSPEQVKVIHDRATAIAYALANAAPSDVILVAGKGHETYQIIGKQTLYYSDRDTVESLLQE
ncbi:UDP-N-acetylmuramoyl-L-alanyl-D-glutamate--2,6-diaminopimelate ligase [Motilimonas sp. KMU-193]|uniref:UDP-N-acetylmuramoyl-L-alanyl-D-glutamate--2, 6-diaminopimelate ligase n=1 Tax=Motilimonas sp. KMU-193 TaxID=3388668 RepID=UPI00396B3A24